MRPINQYIVFIMMYIAGFIQADLTNNWKKLLIWFVIYFSFYWLVILACNIYIKMKENKRNEPFYYTKRFIEENFIGSEKDQLMETWKLFGDIIVKKGRMIK